MLFDRNNQGFDLLFLVEESVGGEITQPFGLQDFIPIN